MRTRLGGGSKIAILSEARRTGAAEAVAAADRNDRRDIGFPFTVPSFSVERQRFRLTRVLSSETKISARALACVCWQGSDPG